MKKLSFIIPCYNEEKVINHLYERLLNITEKIPNYNCEFIFINDGSNDRTVDIIKSLALNNENIIFYSFSRNFGHQAAVSCGIEHCDSDLAVIIDADLQDPPEIIPNMVELYEKTKAPVIYGKRTARKGENLFKKITAYFFYRIINLLSDVKFPVDTGDFRLIDKKVITAYKNFNERPKYIRGLISWMGFEQIPYEYERDARFAGETKYTFKKMLKLALTGILSFSTKPLRISLYFGITALLIAVIYSLYIIIRYLLGDESLATGWSSIIIVSLFIGGVQLISLFAISQYLGNLFIETKKRPEYIISEVIKNSHNVNK